MAIVKKLTERVDKLEEAVEELRKQLAPKPKAAPKPKPEAG